MRNSYGSQVKMIKGAEYNMIFQPGDGYMQRWGKTADDDAAFCPIGPEIMDIEISTICNGIDFRPCTHCYKSNTKVGKNMSFETFKTMFDKFPITVTQIAFGIGDIDSNPDIWKIFEYCRTNGKNVVIPNVTINGFNLTDEYADKLNELCGAVAVSRYSNADVCYDAVEKLTQREMRQVNIHLLVAEETEERCYQTFEDAKPQFDGSGLVKLGTGDMRLKDLNAIVLLTLKPKGMRNRYHSLSKAKFDKLIQTVMAEKMNIGFDSCAAPKFLAAMVGDPRMKKFEEYAEPCESTLFSIYINVDGVVFPCSFMEGENNWVEGIDAVNCNDFHKDIWMNDKVKAFRDSLLCQSGCRQCPHFPIYEGYNG